MTVIPILGSTIGQIFAPFYTAMAWLIAFFYSLVPNYAFAIILLTLVVMAITAPLTVKSTKSMVATQRLQPELKKIQTKYKNDRVALNEEMMKLYREHHINPAGGCLPVIIQTPFFLVLYGVIKGLTNTVTSKDHVVSAAPRYISHGSKLYKSLIASPGHMKSLGIDLAQKLTSHQAHWYGHLPIAALILAAIGLQFFQMRAMTRRNPAAAQANPQMQMMQKYMPIIFGIIYINIAAGVNIYFIVSALCRIGIQEWVFRSGILDKPPRRALAAAAGVAGVAPRRSLMDRMADAQKRALEQQELRQRLLDPGLPGLPGVNDTDPPVKGSPPPLPGPKPPAGGKSPSSGAKPPSGTGSSNGNGSKPAPGARNQKTPTNDAGKGEGADPAAKPAQPRSRAKKPRKAR